MLLHYDAKTSALMSFNVLTLFSLDLFSLEDGGAQLHVILFFCSCNVSYVYF